MSDLSAAGTSGHVAADREQLLRRTEVLAKLLDDAYRVPGTRISVGLDSLLGMIPVVGDVATNVAGAYIVWAGYRLGLSTKLIARMAANLVLDVIVGSIPVVGDVFDLFFKANRRNIELIRRHV